MGLDSSRESDPDFQPTAGDGKVWSVELMLSCCLAALHWKARVRLDRRWFAFDQAGGFRLCLDVDCWRVVCRHGVFRIPNPRA